VSIHRFRDDFVESKGGKVLGQLVDPPTVMVAQHNTSANSKTPYTPYCGS
jgi:hypothetical protein